MAQGSPLSGHSSALQVAFYSLEKCLLTPCTTVDGRNPAPVDRWFIPLFIGFQTSKVVQDFFHPQQQLFQSMLICCGKPNATFFGSCHIIPNFSIYPITLITGVVEVYDHIIIRTYHYLVAKIPLCKVGKLHPSCRKLQLI